MICTYCNYTIAIKFKNMFSILRLFAGIIMKSMASRVTNNGISGKSTHTPMHQDLAETLMATSGHLYGFKPTHSCYYIF